MGDGVKRWYIPLDTVTYNYGQTSDSPCVAVIKEIDHEREVAELKARLAEFDDAFEKYGSSLVLLKKLNETIAQKDRVIAKLKEKVDACVEGHEGTVGPSFWESPLAGELKRIDAELAALEGEK